MRIGWKRKCRACKGASDLGPPFRQQPLCELSPIRPMCSNIGNGRRDSIRESAVRGNYFQIAAPQVPIAADAVKRDCDREFLPVSGTHVAQTDSRKAELFPASRGAMLLVPYVFRRSLPIQGQNSHFPFDRHRGR